MLIAVSTISKIKTWKNNHWVIGKWNQLRNTCKYFIAPFENCFELCQISKFADEYDKILLSSDQTDTCPNWTPVYEWKIHIKKSKWHSKEKDHFSWSLLMLCSGEYYVEFSQLNTCWTCGLQQKMFLSCNSCNHFAFSKISEKGKAN